MEEYINKIINKIDKNNCFPDQYNLSESYDSNLDLCKFSKFVIETEKNNEHNEKISYHLKNVDKIVEERRKIFSIIREKYDKHHDYIKTKKDHIKNGVQVRRQKCNNKYTYDDFKNIILTMS